MAAFCLRLLAYRLKKPRPLSNGVLFERQNKTIIIIIISAGAVIGVTGSLKVTCGSY
jgi:hypothetical protein